MRTDDDRKCRINNPGFRIDHRCYGTDNLVVFKAAHSARVGTNDNPSCPGNGTQDILMNIAVKESTLAECMGSLDSGVSWFNVVVLKVQ